MHTIKRVYSGRAVDAELEDALQAFLDIFGGTPTIRNNADLADLRTRLGAKRSVAETACGRVHVKETQLPSRYGDHLIPLRIFRPAHTCQDLPVIVWFHGGGMIMGGRDQHDDFLKWVCENSECCIISVGYRLAPEHPFPAALEDGRSVLEDIRDKQHFENIDTERIVVAGKSAGGGLAAGLCLINRDMLDIAVTGQILISPMLDYRTGTQEPHASEDDFPVWNRASNNFAWSAYLGSRTLEGREIGYASPLYANRLQGLPQTMIVSADLDLFSIENRRFADRLMDAGVPVSHHHYAGAVHSFDSIAPDAGCSVWMRAAIILMLRRAFQKPSD